MIVAPDGRPAAEAVSISASDVLRRKRFACALAIPRPSISTLAPPAMASSTRLPVSTRPGRKRGEVIPWAIATIRQVDVSASISRFSRKSFPVTEDIVPSDPPLGR